MLESRQQAADALVAEAVATARARAGRRVDPEDLQQAARLAVLEAQTVMPYLDPDHDEAFLRLWIAEALDAEIRASSPGPRSRVTLDELLDDEADAEEDPGPPSDHDADLRLVTDDDVSDEVIARRDVADHVRRIIEIMPAETARIVRLRFGLDGDDPVDPLDVADILDEDPEVVYSHLWTAEKLFRHYSDDGRHRRSSPMTEPELAAFRPLGDLAWYDLRELNLNNADLGGCNLARAVLSGMNLWGLKLVDAVAWGANLWGAQLDGSDLRRADLRSANLERASLCGADLRRVDLSGANLWRADLTAVRADHLDATGADLRAANLVGADLTRANLNNADLRGADLRGATLVGAELAGANLEGVELVGTDLRWADLRNSDLCWSNLSVADLRGASMQGAVRSPKLTTVYSKRAPKPQRLRPVAEPA